MWELDADSDGRVEWSEYLEATQLALDAADGAVSDHRLRFVGADADEDGALAATELRVFLAPQLSAAHGSPEEAADAATKSVSISPDGTASGDEDAGDNSEIDKLVAGAASIGHFLIEGADRTGDRQLSMSEVMEQPDLFFNAMCDLRS